MSQSPKEEPPSPHQDFANLFNDDDALIIPSPVPDSHSLPPKTEDSSERSQSPPPPPKRKAKESPVGPQLVGDLPKAEAEARATFTEMPVNHYQYGTLGRSREANESMLCDCQYDHGTL
jgi:hypothetical protein